MFKGPSNFALCFDQLTCVHTLTTSLYFHRKKNPTKIHEIAYLVTNEKYFYLSQTGKRQPERYSPFSQ